jgi:hypothetical protein
MDRFDIMDTLQTMRVIADTREQANPRAAERFAALGPGLERATLDYGDYCANVTLPDGRPLYDISGRITPVCVIERKMSLDETVAASRLPAAFSARKSRTNVHPHAPMRTHHWAPGISPVFLFFPLFMRVSGGFGLRVRVSCKAPEYKKSPMPWGFHSTRLRLFAMLFWASEMAAVTLN